MLKCEYCPLDGQRFPTRRTVECIRCPQCGSPQPEILLPDVRGAETAIVVLPKYWSCVLMRVEGRVAPIFWKKILYEKQPFPDNFTDRDKFLDYLMYNSGLLINDREFCSDTTPV